MNLVEAFLYVMQGLAETYPDSIQYDVDGVSAGGWRPKQADQKMSQLVSPKG